MQLNWITIWHFSHVPTSSDARTGTVREATLEEYEASRVAVTFIVDADSGVWVAQL